MTRERETVDAMRKLLLSGKDISMHSVRGHLINSGVTIPDTWDVGFNHTVRALEAAGFLVKNANGLIEFTEKFNLGHSVEGFDSRSDSDVRSKPVFNAFPEIPQADRRPPPPPDVAGIVGNGGGRGGGGRGRGDGPPPNNGGNGDDGDGIGGFRAVLMHPFLFSVSEDALNELLDSI